jgi:hypothetical protein
MKSFPNGGREKYGIATSCNLKEPVTYFMTPNIIWCGHGASHKYFHEFQDEFCYRFDRRFWEF